MRQEIHEETPLYKEADVRNDNNLHGFEYMVIHVDQNFLEALRSSALFNPLLAPEKKNKQAFVHYLDDTFVVSYTHNLNAIKYLIDLLTDQKLAQTHDLYDRMHQLVKALRKYHDKHLNKLTEVATNAKNKYSDAIQQYACDCLNNFTTLTKERQIKHRDGDDAAVALEMIARDIERNYKWKAKPTLINHLSKILSIFNNKFDDLYAMIISDHIIDVLKVQLDAVLQSNVPMLPDSRKKYEEYRGLIQRVLDKNIDFPEQNGHLEEDMEMRSMENKF